MVRLVVLVLVALMAPSSLALAQAKIASYREPPYGACRFVQEQLGATPDKWQEETLVGVCDPNVRRISLQACAGPGKTTAEAWTGWYFLGTQCTKGEHPNGFATSITGDNLRDNLWKEFAKWQARSEYLRTAFTWSAERIFANDHAATWFIAARNWPKSGSADEQGRTFSGLHGANVLVLVDESGAIPPTILRAAEQAIGTASGWALIMQGGNPISLEGMLHEAATRLRHQWLIIRVTGDPDDPDAWVHVPRVGPAPAQWAREQIEAYGRENPWVQAYILGKFPPQSINALLSLEDVETAMARRLREDQYSWAQKRIGVDVARFGDDRTVIFPRQGMKAFRPVVMRNARTTDIAARIAFGRAKWSAELVLVDDTGHWGHGVIDNLLTAGIPAVPIVYHAKAIDPRYFNRRAEMHIALAEAVKGGLALPNVPELVGEATAMTYTWVNGTFRIEEKEQVKKRLGKSPDLWDALATTYGLPDQATGVMDRLERKLQDGAGAGKVLSEYDPLAVGEN